MKPEHWSAPRLRILSICEAGLRSRGLIKEWERRKQRRNTFGQPLAVLGCLFLDLGESYASGFRLDGSDRPPIDEKKVVSPTVRPLESKFPDRDAQSCCKVDPLIVLDLPASLGKHAVDPHTGSGLGGQVRLSGWLLHLL